MQNASITELSTATHQLHDHGIIRYSFHNYLCIIKNNRESIKDERQKDVILYDFCLKFQKHFDQKGLEIEWKRVANINVNFFATVAFHQKICLTGQILTCAFRGLHSRKGTQCLFPYTIITTSERTNKMVTLSLKFTGFEPKASKSEHTEAVI